MGIKEIMQKNIDFQKDSVLLTEGLLYSYSPSVVFSGLIHKFGLSQQQIKLLQPDIKIKSKYFEIQFLEENLENIKQILIFMSSLCGWFPSYIFSPETNHKFSEQSLQLYIRKLQLDFTEQFKIGFEAKFNIQVDKKNIPSSIFHATKTSKVPKILKLGLKPTSNSKIATHPDRVYFTLNLDDAEYLVSLFKQNNSQVESYSILSIDTSMLNDNVIFFEDPMFSHFRMIGLYTLSNIHPSAIQLFT